MLHFWFLITNEHTVSVMKNSHMMPYADIIAVCSETSTKHIDALCGPIVEFFNFKLVGKYCNHWTLNG
jgi:hypothetical protein